MEKRPFKCGVLGATGKMGQKILALAQEDPAFTVIGGCGRSGPFLDLFRDADLLIDFSSPVATPEFLELALAHKKPYIIGTTGHLPETLSLMERIGKKIPLLFSPNFSLGFAIINEAIGFLSGLLPKDHRVRIVETHHTQKKDTPSGTALFLAEILGKNPPVESIRTGDVIGEHRIIFEWEGERIEIRHEALTRTIFAKGALFAAKKLVVKPPGLYTYSSLLR